MADVQDKASKGGIGEEGGTVENTNREMEGLEETTYQLAGVVSPMLPTAPANLMSKTSSLRGMKERHANAPAYTGKNENGTSTKDQEETPLNGGAGGGTPENDKEREKKKDSKRQKVAFSAPYTYATKRDYFLLIVGTFFSVAGGAMMPVFMSLFGNVINELNTTLDMNYVCSVMAGVAVASFVASWGAATCFEYTADRQAAHMKLRYFNSILRQEMAYFDVNDPGTLPTRLESNVVTMRNAIGIKLGMMAQFATTAIGGFILGFTRSWRLTLVTLSGLPLLAILGSILGYCLSNGEKGTLSKYKEAGSLSEEALLGIRTIVSLGGEQRTSKEYDKKLHEAERVGVFWSYFSSLCIGCLMGLIFLMFALGFWYGGQMVADSFEDALNGSPPPPLDSDPSTWPVPSFRGGDAITVFFAVLQACFSFGNIVPNISAYMKGAAAAEDLLALINRKSSIDPLSPDGVRDVPLTGDIRLENIVFSYPARKEKKVFNGLNLTLPAGKTIALVGTSG
ncbi:abc transporter transmembrane region domain-containing protein, partial [Cystoisospora suis]